MKQHMMTHKNRDGTPISIELLNSVNSDRSRSRSNASSVGLLSKEAALNKTPALSVSQQTHDDFKRHLPAQPSAGQPIAPQANDRNPTTANLAALMMLNPSPATLKEHCLSLTIQHNANLPHHEGLPLKEQNSSPPSEVLLSLQQAPQQQPRGNGRSGQHSPASSRAPTANKKRGKLQPMTLLPLL